MATPSTTQTTPERLAYSVDEAAAALGVSTITIYRLLQRGKLQSVPGLRTKVIPRTSIEKLLTSAETEAA